MNRAPAFQFYPKDWLDFRVQRMSFEAQGAYLKLLCFMWADSDDQCSIINNNDLLAHALGTTVEHWLNLRGEIQCEFDPILKEKNNRLVSERLKQEALKQLKYRKAQSQKGKQSAQQRLNRGSTATEPLHQPTGKSSSSSSCSLKKKEKTISAASPVVLNGARQTFEIFWRAYPRKRNKGRAEKVWAALKPDDVLVGVMLGKLDQARHSPDWNKENGAFIPYPATWLEAKGWEDVYQTTTSVSYVEPTVCVWKVHHGSDHHSTPCGKPLEPCQANASRPFCREHLQERQRVDAQLAQTESQGQ